MVRRFEGISRLVGVVAAVAVAGIAGAQAVVPSPPMLVDAPDMTGRFVRPNTPALLSAFGGPAGSPVVRSHEYETAVAWIEADPAAPTQDRVAFVRLKDSRLQDRGDFPNVRFADEGAVAELAALDVALSPAGAQPAFAWVEKTAAASRVLVRLPGANPQAVMTGADPMDSTDIVFDGAARPYVAWTVQESGRSVLFAATQDDAGAWRTERLTTDERSYDLLPRLFGNAAGAELYWFSICGSEFTTSVRFLPEDPQGASRFSLAGIPANRLPTLYRTADFRLGSYWLEQTSRGQAFMEIDPRMSEAPVPFAKPENRITELVVTAEAVALKAWIESPGERGAVLVAQTPSGGTLRHGLGRSASSLGAAASLNWTHLVWVEDEGTPVSSVYYMRGN